MMRMMLPRRAGRLALTIALPLLLAAGCEGPQPTPTITSTVRRPTPIAPTKPTVPAQQAVRREVVGRSVENRPIEAIILGQGSEVVLIIASIHGNERAGTPLVRQLADHLQQRPAYLRSRTVILMPVVNPDGLARNARYNARGVDLNRNFAARNRVNNAENGHGALSEPESRALEAVIARYKPSRVIAVHQPLSCIDYDGPAGGLAKQMGAVSGLPVKKLGARPGSLGSYVSLTLGKPIVTVELPRGAETLDSQALWKRYGSMLVTAVTYSPGPIPAK